MRVGIVGSRFFTNYELFKKIVLESGFEITSVVSGGARGVDTLAKKYAKELNLPLFEFYPDYLIFGSKAPLVRNKEIVNNSDKLIAIPTYGSRGTWNTIRHAKARKIPIFVKLV